MATKTADAAAAAAEAATENNGGTGGNSNGTNNKSAFYEEAENLKKLCDFLRSRQGPPVRESLLMEKRVHYLKGSFRFVSFVGSWMLLWQAVAAATVESLSARPILTLFVLAY
jgi:hypothetical protein